MGYADQKYYDRPQVSQWNSAFVTATATASGTNTITPFYPDNFMRAKQINNIYAVCQVAPATNAQPLFVYFVNGTTSNGTFGTLAISQAGTASATKGQVVVGVISAPVKTTNTFTNTLPNGSTIVTSNTTTTSYNQFGSGSGPTVYLVFNTATASGQSAGQWNIEFEEQELYQTGSANS
jgi:hypothetical protein